MLDKISAFVNSIGIKIESENNLTIENRPDPFIDNIWIKEGVIYINSHSAPGCLLHEIGHLAIMPSPFRAMLSGNLTIPLTIFDDIPLLIMDKFGNQIENPLYRQLIQVDDSAVSAWSYAAAIKIGIDSFLPFENGYDGNGLEIWESLESSRMSKFSYYCGIDSLYHAGMLLAKSNFPNLNRWVQL